MRDYGIGRVKPAFGLYMRQEHIWKLLQNVGEAHREFRDGYTRMIRSFIHGQALVWARVGRMASFCLDVL